jgi:hypothetical protein
MAPLRLYAVVEFNNNSIAVVPYAWIREIEPNRNVCLWPSGNVTEKIVNMVKKICHQEKDGSNFHVQSKALKVNFV